MNSDEFCRACREVYLSPPVERIGIIDNFELLSRTERIKMQQVADIADTQLFGMKPKHALTCYICGTLLPDDLNFQVLHMEKVHKMTC